MSFVSRNVESVKSAYKERMRKWKNLPPERVQAILIMRLSSIGDIVLTSPIIRATRQQYPGARIVYLTKLEYAPILASNPYIDEVLTLDDSMSSTISALRDYDFDLMLDLHKNIRTRRIKRGLKGVQYYTFDKLNLRKWLYTALKINALPLKSIVDRYFEGLSKLQLVNDGHGLDFFIPQKEKINMQVDLPMSHNVGYVVGVIGGTYATKKMPAEKWEELCDSIKMPIVLVGGPEDRELGYHLETLSRDKKVYNACGKFSLHESADIIRRSKGVISHDTGMMHIAAAFSKPIITLWGNTDKHFGMFPYLPSGAPKYADAEVKLRCRPCSKLGYNQCPKKHFRCMQEQSIPNILKELEKSLLLANQN